MEKSKPLILAIILQRRLLNRNKHCDYIYFIILALIPVVFSWWLGIHDSMCLDQAIKGCTSTVFYKGYWDTYNWTGLVIMLPVGLFLLRWVVSKLFGEETATDENEDAVPPILLAFQEDRRAQIQKHLSTLSHEGWNFVLVFCLTLLFHIADMWEIGTDYFGYFFPEMMQECNENIIGWQNFFLAKNCYQLSQPSVDVLTNLSFTLLAYLSQFTIVFIAFMTIALFVRFNLFYLSRIYQRSRVSDEEIGDYIVLNFDDFARSFGFRKLHVSFNIQLLALVIAGLFVLVSRYGNVPSESRPNIGELIPQKFRFQELMQLFEKLDISGFFPDIGQIIMSVSWILAFSIVLLPTLTKFLPITSRIVRTRGMNITDYLREFIPPEAERTQHPLTTDVEISTLADKFARNSFWPAGDDIARFFLYFAFFVFLIILFPLNINGLAGILGIGFLFLSSIGMAHGILKLFRFTLGHIDQRLI